MTGFETRDRRGERRHDGNALDHSRLTRHGMNVRRAVEETGGDQLYNQYGHPNRRGMTNDAVEQMRKSRVNPSRMRRTASVNGPGPGVGPSMQMATGRPRDPMWYWKQNNIPFDFTEPTELQRIREFCNTPDAPITMADGTTTPIGEIQVGDQVRGWDFSLQPLRPELSFYTQGSSYGGNGGRVRHYKPATVLAINTRTAPDVIRLTMASGQQITCTPDHKWANPYYSTQVQYNSPYPPMPATTVMCTEYWPAAVGKELLDVEHAAMDKVVSIEHLGSAEVVSMQTTLGNYIAWGYASKNCRLLYVTHPIVAACIDIYSKFPLQGLHFECKDDQLVEFYTDLFFGEDLNYENHLLKVGRQYWLTGESWSLGGWNETLGVWEGDQLINPDDVEVENSLFLAEPRFLMRLPESLRKVLTTRTPHWQYSQLVMSYPELVEYTQKDDLMPVSNVLLKQLRFEADDFSNRGIPILMRGFRTIIQEEMLNSALDSIADRLYTPLILTKLGATASDLGTTVPWIPDQDEMEEFNAALDAALAADFRALTYHWAIDMEPVFGRENVPDLSNDFDRITERLLMVFGLSQTMLTGASAGETYAADALNRDIVTQLLTHYQRMLSNFYVDRARIVAEAQEHFDYEVRNGKRYLVTEEIYEVDEETGEGRIVEQPKLLVPDLKFSTLNLTDEDAERQFIESLAEAGVPVPYRARISTTGLDFDEMVEQRSQEEVALAVAEQETRKKKYLALQAGGFPIADDLQQDFGAKAIQAGAETPRGMDNDMATPGLGQGDPTSLPALAPGPDDFDAADQAGDETAVPSDQDADMNGEPDTEEGGAPADDIPQEGDDVPPESSEQRGRMPKSKQKAAAVQKTAAIRKLGIREATLENYQPPDNSEEENPRDYRPSGKFGDPHHIGMRRHLAIPEDVKLREDTDPPA
jgi:hypothetical protein